MQRVNIIGAGLAGLSCALTLARQGVPSRIVSPHPSERAQSVMAEGGLNAVMDVMGENDTLAEHFEDTMRGGVWLADPNAVWGMVREAPDIVRDYIALGVPFQTENGKLVQRNFGGQKKKRTVYAKSSTGKVLVTSLVDAVRRLEGNGTVLRLARHELSGLRMHDGQCLGAWIRDTYTNQTTLAPGPVVIATGGYSGLFGSRNTGTTVNTGDATALVYAAGVELANLEFVQYHPTTVLITGKRMLITEAARGEGGRLYTLRRGEPWYFMEEKYPELGNLMPRDVVSREEESVMADPECADCVWLDMRGLSKRIWDTRLSDLREEIIHYLRIDPAREPVPVEPGIHYCMGGIAVDEGHRTNVSHLYAAGECAAQYHGANRLGANSLLGATYGGRVAGRSALADLEAFDWAAAEEAQPLPDDLVIGPLETPACDNPADALIHEVLNESMGMKRDAQGLNRALEKLSAIDLRGATGRAANRVRLAQAIVASARAREESRGAHYRDDFPDTRDEFRKTTICRLANGAPVVEHRPIPELREGGEGL